jgi:hypothetical protein
MGFVVLYCIRCFSDVLYYVFGTEIKEICNVILKLSNAMRKGQLRGQSTLNRNSRIETSLATCNSSAVVA